MPVQIMIYALLLILTLWTGWLPVGHIPLAMIAGWAIWTAAAVLAAHGLSRGNQTALDGEINTWVTARPYLNAWLMLLTHRSIPFRVTPKLGVDEGGRQALRMLSLPAAVLGLTVLALVVRVVAEVVGNATGYWFLPQITTNVMVVIGLFALWQIVTLMRTLRRYTKRRQYRLLWRFPVDLDASLGNTPARVVDLHEAGARVHVPAGIVTAPTMPIEIQVHDAQGETRMAYGTLIVRSTTEVEGGVLALGGSCAWDSIRDRRWVIFETHVYAPLMATKRLESTLLDDVR